jgi:hypothetical protein
MKRLVSITLKLFLIVGIVLSFHSPTFATEVLTASASGGTITATLTGLPFGSGSTINLVAQKTPFTNNTPLVGYISSATKTVSPDGTINFTLKDLAGNTDYYVRAENSFPVFVSNTVKVTTGQETILADDLVYGTPSSDCKSIYISGKLRNSNLEDYSIDLQYATDAFVMTGDKQKDKILPPGAYKQGAQKDTAGNLGINSDGTYGFNLTLLPSTQYFVKQVITSKSGAMDIKTDKFNSCRGYVVTGSSEDVANTNRRSYTLLAPIPGLTQVLDYDLCKEREAQGAVATGSCDNQIGYFINLLIQIMIGLSAVVLVVQIILRGYQYMVTDIPKLKLSAKDRLFEAFGGLLLALSSYLILNTINPKLVAGTLNVSNIDIGVDEATVQRDALEVQNSGGGNGTVKLCTDVASCKALCIKTNNGSNYTETPPGVMDASKAQKIENIPLVSTQSSCINCTASASVIQGLKNLKPSIDTLISQGSIPRRDYTFTVVSAYRPAKDQIRIMCGRIGTKPQELGSKYAYPALSRHGIGTAIDVTFFWDGKKVTNAGTTRQEGTIEKIMDKAGFERLNIEAWHFEYGGGPQTCKYPNCGEPRYTSL